MTIDCHTLLGKLSARARIAVADIHPNYRNLCATGRIQIKFMIILQFMYVFLDNYSNTKKFYVTKVENLKYGYGGQIDRPISTQMNI